MNKPLISVIVPVYKAEKYIGKCIESIIQQSNKSWELLLIDDGSPDKSGEICDNYAVSDDRIHVYHQNNSGVSSARNIGLKEAKGEWTCFVDADDWIHPSTLDLPLICNKKSDFIQFGFQKINENGEILFKSKLPIEVLECSQDDYLSSTFYHSGICGYFIRTALYKNNAIDFPTHIKYGEDQAFILKLLFLSKFCSIYNQHYYNYLDNCNSAMNATISFERVANNLDTIKNIVDFAHSRSFQLSRLHLLMIRRFSKSYCWWGIKCLNRFNDLYKIKHMYSEFLENLPIKNLDIEKYNSYALLFFLFLMYKLHLKR